MSGIRANLGGHGTSPSSSSPSVHLQLFLPAGFLASVSKAEADTTEFDPSVAISPELYFLVVISSSVFLIIFLLALICSVYLRHRYEEEGSSLARILSTLTREERAVATPRMPSPWRPGPPWGLDPALIEAFPELLYAAVKDHKLGKGALECAVCLEEFDDDDSLRLLPKCDHVFHADCIDAWLAYHTTCPVCRADLRSSDAAARPLPEPAAAAPASPPAHVVIAVDESPGRPDSAEDCE